MKYIINDSFKNSLLYKKVLWSKFLVCDTTIAIYLCISLLFKNS